MCATEGLTAALILALLPLPLELAIAILPAIGMVLNGNIFRAVRVRPELVARNAERAPSAYSIPARSARARVAPVIYGLVADALGSPPRLIIAACARAVDPAVIARSQAEPAAGGSGWRLPPFANASKKTSKDQERMPCRRPRIISLARPS